jgi:DNA-binding MarR family transcriptional regulator
MQVQETFVDGIGNLAVQASLARIELTQLEKLPSANEKPNYLASHRLVMGIETLLRLHQALNEVVKQLEEKGVVKKSPDKASPRRSSKQPAK